MELLPKGCSQGQCRKRVGDPDPIDLPKASNSIGQSNGHQDGQTSTGLGHIVLQFGNPSGTPRLSVLGLPDNGATVGSSRIANYLHQVGPSDSTRDWLDVIEVKYPAQLFLEIQFKDLPLYFRGPLVGLSLHFVEG